MTKYFHTLILLFLGLCTTTTAVAQESSTTPADLPVEDEKIVLGWVERALLFPSGFALNAKLDSGADNSSLHAENLEFTEEKGKKYVSFELFNRHGDKHQMKLPVVRSTKIKLKNGGLQRRPVVRLGLCLGGLYREVDFNLVDRSHFYYPMLIGRSFLSGNVIIDSSKTYSLEPNCKPPTK